MINVLILTGLLPIEEIDKKKNENDILLVTEDYMARFHPDVRFHYIFNSPKVNRLIAFFNGRWKAYYKLQRQRQFQLRGRTIYTLGIIMLPQKLFFKNILYAISYWQNRKLIDNIVKRTQPTVVHAQSIGANAYFAHKISKKYKIPYVVTLRGTHSSEARLNIKVLKEASHLIAINHLHKKVVEDKLSRNIQIIPHGIPDLFFNNISATASMDRLSFVTVCHLIERKNIDKVITALSRITRDYLFHIYGEGPEKQNLQQLIHQLELEEKIKLMGHIKNTDLPGTLIHHHLFIMPSDRETLGRVYFEAMACGLPVVATKGTGIDGIVTDGVEGFLADTKDPRSLDHILQRVVDNPETILEMRQHALQLAENFKWESISKLLYNVYTK